MPTIHATRALAAGALTLALALALGGARAAEEKTYVMKITLPTLNDTVHELAKRLGATIEKDSGGRIKAEVYPASQLGPIARQIEAPSSAPSNAPSSRRSSSSASTSASR